MIDPSKRTIAHDLDYFDIDSIIIFACTDTLPGLMLFGHSLSLHILFFYFLLLFISVNGSRWRCSEVATYY